MARALVARRLAACVQILPIESVYRWHDGIETSEEQMLLCKIRERDVGIVEAAIRARHSYEVPEIVVVPIVAGSIAYLGWLRDTTAGRDDGSTETRNGGAA